MEYTDPYTNVPQPILTIFGANGNLSIQKLLPSLFALTESNHLRENCSIVCVTLEPLQKELLMQQLEVNMLRRKRECNPAVLKRLGDMITMIQMDLMNQEDYQFLATTLDMLDEKNGGQTRNRLFYLAIPPSIFQDVISRLHVANLHSEKNGAATRILIEKPFGTNLESAQKLIDFTEQHFREEQIYRIDHYLAKETAQNILTFRTQNPLIEDIWGRQFIDHIQITVSEVDDIGWRGAFYEKTGALRDIVQSHLIQLMSLVMMEVPLEMNSKSIHSEKQALLDAIQPMKDNQVGDLAVRGQYDSYSIDVGNPDSRIETYAAIKLEVTNSRWGGVPVLLRTGKGLDKKVTEIHIVFKDRSRRNVHPNILTIRIQPDEGIVLQLLAKHPGFTEALQPVRMDFCYATAFSEKQPDAYERVLMDAMIGDQSLFATSREVLQAWAIVEPIIRAWDGSSLKPEMYSKGSKGPHKAEALAEEFGNEWI